MSAPRALNRLWNLFEDEFRIARENGVFRQEIVVDGSSQLADVVRLGTMMMYFRTSDGRLGSVQREGTSWSYETVSGSAAKQIEALFASFEKQVRTGFFEVPNAIVGAPR